MKKIQNAESRSDSQQSRKRTAQLHDDSKPRSRNSEKSCTLTTDGHRSIKSSPNKQVRSPSSAKQEKNESNKDLLLVQARCYEQPQRRKLAPCRPPIPWQEGEYVKDECGSGIVSKKNLFHSNLKNWCKTPLTMYQSSIGEFGRQILCREIVIQKDVKPEPPCSISEFIVPLCRGYYRKKDCLRPCEEEHVTYKRGQKVYRDCFERYWQPCLTQDEKVQLDVKMYAPHNSVLGLKMKRKFNEEPCW